MDTWKIKDHTLEYDDAEHMYICDGIIVPSVTQILKQCFPSKYAGIPESVLNEAVRVGTLLHSAIESYEKNGISDTPAFDEVSTELHNYRFLKDKHGFSVVSTELPVIIEHNGEIVSAGRLDLVISENDVIGLGDIKRTSELDGKYLSYQLSMYAAGMKYSYDMEVSFLRCIHLRKDVRKYKEIPFVGIDEVLGVTA